MCVPCFWGALGAFLGAQERLMSEGGRRSERTVLGPLRDFLRKFLPDRDLKTLEYERSSRGGLNTPCCARGGGSRTPCGRTPPPLRKDLPLAGCVQQVMYEACDAMVARNVRVCSGTLGVSYGMQTILRGMREANLNAFGALGAADRN